MKAASKNQRPSQPAIPNAKRRRLSFLIGKNSPEPDFETTFHTQRAGSTDRRTYQQWRYLSDGLRKPDRLQRSMVHVGVIVSRLRVHSNLNVSEALDHDLGRESVQMAITEPPALSVARAK